MTSPGPISTILKTNGFQYDVLVFYAKSDSVNKSVKVECMQAPDNRKHVVRFLQYEMYMNVRNQRQRKSANSEQTTIFKKESCGVSPHAALRRKVKKKLDDNI